MTREQRLIREEVNSMVDDFQELINDAYDKIGEIQRKYYESETGFDCMYNSYAGKYGDEAKHMLSKIETFVDTYFYTYDGEDY